MKKVLSCLLIFLLIISSVQICTVFAEEINETKMGENIDGKTDEETATVQNTYQIKEAIHQLESIQEKCTDRFIVKVKENSAKGISSAVEAAYAVAKETRKELVSQAKELLMDVEKTINIQGEYERAERLLEGFDQEQRSAFFQFDRHLIKEIKDLQDNKQLIYLNEKIEPESFVRELQGRLNGELEYVQPDYQVELAAAEEENISIEIIPIASETDRKSEEVLDNEASDTAVKTSETEEKSETTDLAKDTSVLNENMVDSALNNETEADDSDVELQEVIVAIIDTGIDITHPDLEEYVTDGYNFISEDEVVYDETLGMEQAHGTHVAGIIAQTAPNVKIMPLKCFENGKAYTSDLIDAIRYAEENGASIVNCSWGSVDNNSALREAMEQSNLFFVCAAGNNRTNVDETPIYPASFGLDNSISVTALNQDNGFCYFSNYGTSIDIAAHGRDVESCFPGGRRGTMNGTSMAAGFVSGAAAIAKGVGEENLKSRLVQTGDMFSHLQNKLKDGRVLNIDNLLKNIYTTEIAKCNSEDDFDVHGYQPTPEESWELFADQNNIQSASGGNFTLVLKSDGTVWGWGNNDCGQLGDGTAETRSVPKKVIGLSDIVSIAAGVGQAVALKSNGTVYAWGDNAYGQIGDGTKTNRNLPVKIDSLNSVSQITAGRLHTAALTETGIVYMWGNNNRGQLGDGTTTEHLTPIPIDLAEVAAVSAGGSHTVAISKDGTIYEWGDNTYGQIGDGTTTRRYRPVLVNGVAGAKKVSAGTNHTIAITEENEVYAWGDNSSGQLGNGTQLGNQVPLQVSGLSGIIDISAGAAYNIALADDGSVYTWGENSNGQLGDGTTILRTMPVQISELSRITYISAGQTHSSAIMNNAYIYTWGSNIKCEVGFDGQKCSVPVPLSGLTDVAVPVAGMYHSLAVMENGKIMSWGYNSHGQLGNGTKTNSDMPGEITNLADVKTAAAGYYHSLAVKSDGTVYAWGFNGYGQLGTGTAKNHLIPTKVKGLTNVQAVSAGAYHSLALLQDGTVYAWGRNEVGQLGDGTNIDRSEPVHIGVLKNIKAIAAGYYTSYAITEEGELLAWGANQFSQVCETDRSNKNIPVQLERTGIKMVSGGLDHTIALREDGIVLAWGHNGYGQLGDGTTNNYYERRYVAGVQNVQSITAGQYHSMALKEDGTIVTWGANNYGQLGNGTDSDSCSPVEINNVANAVNIDAGNGHNLVLKEDKTMLVWGNNGSGQLGCDSFYKHTVPYFVGMGINDDEDMSTAKQIQLGEAVTDSIDFPDDVDWYMFTSPRRGTYSYQITSEYKMELYDSKDHPIRGYSGEAFKMGMEHLRTVYIKVTKTTAGLGNYVLNIGYHISYKDVKRERRAHLVTMNGNEYYSDLYDNERLYKNETPLTNESVEAICVKDSIIYFSTNNAIYKLENDTVSQLINNINAKFIVADKNKIYFSNWTDGGKIYAVDLATNMLAKICNDAGVQLYLSGNYIYYYNVNQGSVRYRTLKTAQDHPVGQKM